MSDARAVRLEMDREHRRELARERSRRYRDRKRGGEPLSLKPCGTRAAKVRHQRNPEKHGRLEDCPTCSPPGHSPNRGDEE